MRFQHLANAALVATAMASPTRPMKQRAVTTVTVSGSTATTYPQPAYELQGFPIHQSCNGTERLQLEKAFGDTLKLAQQAANHIYTHGAKSAFYTKYFGDAATAEVIGWYEKVVYGSREGVLFRCDDIDGNCHQEGWGGHWRGENATLETVICPLSYQTRQPIEALCGNGYTVANGPLSTYFAADLLHRLYHVESIGEEAAEHYADTYTECLELATANSSQAVRNTHTLQYFALDVYAYEIALPNEGCTGVVAEESAPAAPAASSVSSATGTAETTLVTEVASATSADAASTTASKTTSAGVECHTHADGEVHCV